MAGGATVYVVDDDEASAGSLEALLTTGGFTVTVCHSAEAFLAAFDERRQACLVLDVRLGGMSGLALQKRLASQGTTLPTIMISGHGDEQLRDESLNGGSVAFLTKPFDGGHLCQLVRNIFQQVAPERP